MAQSSRRGRLLGRALQVGAGSPQNSILLALSRCGGTRGDARGLAAPPVQPPAPMTQSRGRRLGGTSGSIKGASASLPRTRILALTGEVELRRLLRSLLEPNGCKVVASAVPHDNSATNDPFDIVIVDLESLHLDVISQVMRAYPDAQIIAICGAYREADCIAVLDMGADYVARPFRALDLSARVRVAELRQFKAKGHRRYYRRGSFVVDLFDRKVVLAGEPLALRRRSCACAQRRPSASPSPLRRKSTRGDPTCC